VSRVSSCGNSAFKSAKSSSRSAITNRSSAGVGGRCRFSVNLASNAFSS
jgi:hypothetical protein